MSEPTFTEIAEESVNLVAGAVAVLLPLFVLSVPIMFPLAVFGGALVAVIALAAAVLAAPIVLIVAVVRASRRIRLKPRPRAAARVSSSQPL